MEDTVGDLSQSDLSAQDGPTTRNQTYGKLGLTIFKKHKGFKLIPPASGCADNEKVAFGEDVVPSEDGKESM